MNTSPNPQLFFPCFALMLLTVGVLVRMFLTRINALKSKSVRMSYFKTYKQDEALLPDKMLQASRNFTNLFEVPTLFYMICLFATVLNQVDPLIVGLAWVYVISRFLHSLIHLSSNNIYLRMSFYGLSWLVLIFMSVRLAMNLLQA